MHFREFAQTVARSSLEANTPPCLLMCDLCKLVSVFMRDKLSTYSKLCELSKHCLRGARIFALFTLYKPLHDFQADSTLCCRFAPSLTSSIDINLPCVVQVKRPKRASMRSRSDREQRSRARATILKKNYRTWESQSCR